MFSERNFKKKKNSKCIIYTPLSVINVMTDSKIACLTKYIREKMWRLLWVQLSAKKNPKIIRHEMDFRWKQDFFLDQLSPSSWSMLIIVSTTNGRLSKTSPAEAAPKPCYLQLQREDEKKQRIHQILSFFFPFFTNIICRLSSY